MTPNRCHYVPLLAALTPTRFHRWLNKRRGREEDDTFPTYYRLNTPQALRPALRGFWFRVNAACSMIEVQPNYLQFTTPTYLLGARLQSSCGQLHRTGSPGAA